MIYTVTLNPARDRSVVIPDFAAGKVNRITEIRNDPGGKGINVSKIIKELGGASIAMGVLGGGTGAYIKESLDKMGIASMFTFVEAETRTNTKISDPVNRVTTDINEPGAALDSQTSRKVLDTLLEQLLPGDIVVVAGKLDTKAVDIAGWIASIQLKGARVFLDTEGAALSAGVAAQPYLIKPNDAELRMLTGETLTTESDLVAAGRRLVAHGIEIALISLGSDGALCITKDAVLRSKGVKVEAVSTVGAGDTMMGAFAYGLKDGIRAAFALSVAASAAAVTCPGTKCPELSVVKELLTRTVVYEI